MDAIKTNFYWRHDRVTLSWARKQGQIGAQATAAEKTEIIAAFMNLFVRSPIPIDTKH